MTEAEFLEAKRLRRAARNVFDTQRDLVKADLGAASLGKRIVSRIADDGRAIADEAVCQADRHKVAVSAGVLALTGWFLRKPIMEFAQTVLFRGDEGQSDPDNSEPTEEAVEER